MEGNAKAGDRGVVAVDQPRKEFNIVGLPPAVVLEEFKIVLFPFGIMVGGPGELVLADK